MKKYNPLAILALTIVTLGAFAFTGCNSSATRVESTWTAPGTQKISFNKVLVVMLTPDGASRRLAEDAIKAQLPAGLAAVQSYTVVADLKNGRSLEQVLEDMNFDGAVVVRFVGRDTEITTTTVPGRTNPHSSFWGHYGAWGWDNGWTTEINSSVIVGMETNIYDMVNDRLLWSAVTRTTDPRNINALVDDAGRAITRELQRQGLVAAGK